MEKKYLERFTGKEMRSKIAQYPIFGEVIYKSLTATYELLERTKRNYTLFAYVRKSEDKLRAEIFMSS